MHSNGIPGIVAGIILWKPVKTYFLLKNLEKKLINLEKNPEGISSGGHGKHSKIYLRGIFIRILAELIKRISARMSLPR